MNLFGFAGSAGVQTENSQIFNSTHDLPTLNATAAQDLADVFPLPAINMLCLLSSCFCLSWFVWEAFIIMYCGAPAQDKWFSEPRRAGGREDAQQNYNLHQ